MKYYTISPPARLARLVRYFWVLEGELESESYIHRTTADGCVEIVFHYKAAFDEITAADKIEQSFTAGISGQSQKFRRFITRENFGIFGVYLYPYAVPQLFSFSATDVSNQIVSLAELLGKEGAELTEKMLTAIDNTHRTLLISAFLEKRLDRKSERISPVIHAVNQVIHAEELVNVRALAKNFDLSTRQFERKFKELAGFSPKLFSRIIRFQSAAGRYGANLPRLTDIAYDCGYYDQSHFIHDFKEFSGYHPKTFFSGSAEGTEWR